MSYRSLAILSMSFIGACRRRETAWTSHKPLSPSSWNLWAVGVTSANAPFKRLLPIMGYLKSVRRRF